MKYWELNKDRRIVLLHDFGGELKAGYVSCLIPDVCELPSQEEPILISKSATIKDGASIGGFVIIDDDVVIGRHSKIGAFSTIKKGSIIGDYVEIGNGSNVGSGAKIGDGVVIGWNARLCE